MKKLSFLSLSIFVVCVCMCISCGYLISSAVLTSFGFTSTVSHQSQKVYAISLQKSENQNKVEENIATFQAENAACFIFEKDDEFFLLASLYENLNDAELVKSNLKASGAEAEIVEIEIPNKSIEGSFSSEEKEILSAALKANFEVFKQLYDVAISLDTGVLDKSNAKLECNKIYSSLISTKTNLETFFKDNSAQIKSLKEDLSLSAENLLKLICEEYSCKAQTFSSLIKETYCKVLLIK